MTHLVPKTEEEVGGVALFQEATIFDVQRFEQVDRVANVMARASLLPDHLKAASYETTYSNCFVIANYAATVGMDPFMVAQASAIVFGKLVLEGKLVRAVIKRFVKSDLHYAFFGSSNDADRRVFVADFPLTKFVESEDPRVDAGELPLTEDEIRNLKSVGRRITVGTFAKWHTKNKNGGVNDNWLKDETKMFRERGAREWCREWEPGLMLGVYTPDEFDEVEQTSRSNRARDITPRNPLLDETQNTEAQSASPAKQTMGGRKDDESPASAKPASTDAGGPGNADTGTRAQDNSAGDDAPDAGGEPRESETQSAVATLSREVFETFSGALARVKSVENLQKAKDEFFKGKGLRPNETETKLFQTIYKAHEDRIKGGMDVGKVMAEVADRIAVAVPEGEKL